VSNLRSQVQDNIREYRQNPPFLGKLKANPGAYSLKQAVLKTRAGEPQCFPNSSALSVTLLPHPNRHLCRLGVAETRR
jgi:hypothetical protein